MTLSRIINRNLADFINRGQIMLQPTTSREPRLNPTLLTSLFLQSTTLECLCTNSYRPRFSGPNLLSESPEFAEKLTPLFVGSAITPWYKSTSLLDNECPTFLPTMSGRHLLPDSPTLDCDGKFGSPQLSGNLLIE
jgi:hypothetical protein